MNLGKFRCDTGENHILWRKDDLTVRTSTMKDLSLVDKLQKENSNAVGFIPNTIWEKYVWGGERNFMVFICEANNDEVGYVLITPGKGPMSRAKIQQIAVRNDARRLQYGSALVDVGRDFCQSFGLLGFTLRCRADLESNHFWNHLGFRKYGIWKKGQFNHVGFKATNDINLWTIDLNDKILPLDFCSSDEQLLIVGGK